MNKLHSTFRKGFIAAATVGFMALTSSAQAVTLNVVGGQLLGASGINVDGKLFDVEFLDGSCVALFGGWDAITDFAFQTAATALVAAAALLDTVLIDGPLGAFDSDPELTRGISSQLVARILIPFAAGRATVTADMVSLQNEGLFDAINQRGFRIQQSTFGEESFTYARFTAAPVSTVPLPPAGILFGSGLVFLAAMRRRAKKRT